MWTPWMTTKSEHGADELTKVILIAMQAVLKPIGFTKKGATFRRETEEATQIVSLQRSSSSTKDVPVVTVNLGTTLHATRRYLKATRPVTSVGDCDWQQRIGAYTENRDDKWWTVGNHSEASSAGEEVAALLRSSALPELDRMSTESAGQDMPLPMAC